MATLSCLVIVLASILNAYGATVPSSSNIIVSPPNKFEFTTLTVATPETAAAANAADASSPNPDIAFLATVKAGIELEKSIVNSSHPAIIIGEWYHPPRPHNLTRYPTLKVLFLQNVLLPFNRFQIRTNATTYPNWSLPENSQFGMRENFAVWRSFNITMDLPEAWRRACEAGWRHPLNQFGLVKGKPHAFGTDIPPYDSYFFIPPEHELDPITVNAVTGEVTLFHSTNGKPLDWNSFSGAGRYI